MPEAGGSNVRRLTRRRLVMPWVRGRGVDLEEASISIGRIVSNIFCTETTRFTNPSLRSSGLGFQDSTKVPLRPEFNSFLNPKPLPSLP